MGGQVDWFVILGQTAFSTQVRGDLLAITLPRCEQDSVLSEFANKETLEPSPPVLAIAQLLPKLRHSSPNTTAISGGPISFLPLTFGFPWLSRP